MTKFPGFPSETIPFLKDLAANNDRDWFAENKARYEAVVLEPSLEFIEAMQQPIKKLSPHFLAVPKKVGGSLMRIYRDTRFSKDKAPYKTNIGIQFRHEFGSDIHAPGFYVHVAPDECFLGVGIWHPEKEPLRMIRQAILDDPSAWKKATQSKAFADVMQLGGDSLKRAPADFDPAHPLIEDLKRKDYIAGGPLTVNEITSPKLIETLITRFKAGSALMKFLCRALEIPY
ncbi:DUF2461 domain-containing protein [Lacunimicrobium album]